MDVDVETRRIADVLCQRHPVFARRTVDRLVARTFEEFATSTVTAYLPVLVQRRADALLRELDFDFGADRHDASRHVMA